MRIVFDTNVLMDVLLVREPHVRDAALLVDQVEIGRLVGLVVATTVTTLSYFVERAYGNAEARADIRDITRVFEIAPVGRASLEVALDSPIGDFEDAVLTASARLAAADGIVTRNPRDFADADLPIYTPRELLQILA